MSPKENSFNVPEISSAWETDETVTDRSIDDELLARTSQQLDRISETFRVLVLLDLHCFESLDDVMDMEDSEEDEDDDIDAIKIVLDYFLYNNQPCCWDCINVIGLEGDLSRVLENKTFYTIASVLEYFHFQPICFNCLTGIDFQFV